MRSDKFPAEIETQITKCNKNLLYPKERVKQIFSALNRGRKNCRKYLLDSQRQMIDDIKKVRRKLG